MNFGKWSDLKRAEHSSRMKQFFKTKDGEKARRKLSRKAKRRMGMYGSLDVSTLLDSMNPDLKRYIDEIRVREITQWVNEKENLWLTRHA